MGNLCWIASYPKSGNTWVRAFIENYLQNRHQPVDINLLFRLSQAEANAFRYVPYVQGGDTTSLSTAEICAIRPLVHADLAREANGTAFVKTHNFLGEYQGYPLHNSSVTSGAIYIVRNPLDVVISVANYFSFTIDQAIDFMAEEMTGTGNEKENVPQIISSWSVHVESWTQNPDPSILIVRYEDMLQKPLKAFAKIVAFIGQTRDTNRLKKATRFSSFNQLKAQENAKGFVEKHEDAKSFFRSGRSNQWREKLTRSQIQKIVDQHGFQMARFKYMPSGFQKNR